MSDRQLKIGSFFPNKMSRRSSSRREDVSVKSKKKEVMEINSDSEDEEDDKADDAEVVSLSDASSEEEVIAPKKSRNASYNKAAFSMPDDISKLMNRVLCTSCGKQLNPMNHGAVRKHPWLKVVTCKKCYKFLKSGPFTRGEDGIDEQCRWCGDGGRLYGCDYCHNCFCRSCIKRNMGRTEAADMENQIDSKSKWKCYMCDPKKIKTLQDNCSKILEYIRKEEEKEKQKEERAKQREKEKAQAAKEKKQNDKEADRKDKRNSLPIPKMKVNLNDSRDKTPNKSGFPAPKPKDSIVIDDSPEKPVNKLATAKSHLTTYIGRPGDGVKQVQRMGNGVTQVVVGPKAKQPVVMPYRDGMKLNDSQNFARQTGSLQRLLAPKPMPTIQVNNRPNLLGALTTQLAAPSVTIAAPSNVTITEKKRVAPLAKPNDIRALKEQIVPFNVETLTEKLSTVSQAFSLAMNSVKTDLAIAKLSSSNLFNSRSTAAYSVKTGLDVFFNNMRDIFNVQITMVSPSADEPINLDDDVKSEKGLPNGTTNNNSDKDSAKESVKSEVKDEKKEVKEEVKSEVKEEIKMETNGPVKNESEEEVKTEDKSNDNETKMETDQDENSDKDKKDRSDKDSDKKDSKMETDQDESSDKDKKDKSDKDKKDKSDKDKKDKSEKDSNKKDSSEAEKGRSSPKKTRGKERKAESEVDSSSESEANTKTKGKDKTTSKSKKAEEPEEADEDEDTAASAELDLLKDLDEINEDNEKDESMDEVMSEPRRSSRRQKSQDSSQEDNDEDADDDNCDQDKSSESEQTTRRSSSRRKQPNKESNDEKESVDNKKTGKKTEKESEEKIDNKRTSKKSEKESEDEKKGKDKKESKDTKDLDDDDKKSKDKTKESPNDKKSDSKSKSGSKSSKSSTEAKSSDKKDSDESMNKDNSDDNDDDDDDDSDSSVSSAEFGKRRKTRRQKQKEEDTGKTKGDGKSKGSKSEKADKVEKSDKSKSKEKSAKSEKSEKADKKEARKTRSKNSSEEKEEYHSDSSNFDADLEKDIKSLSKDTKLTRSSRRTAKGEEKEENDNDDKKKGKGKSDKNKKGKSEEDSEDDSQEKSDQDEEDEEDAENSETEEAPKDKKNKSKDKNDKKENAKGSKKSKMEVSDDDDDDDGDVADDESKDDEDEENEEDEDNLSPSQLRKLRAAQKTEEGSDYEDMEASGNSDSEDPEVSFPKLETPKKGKKGKGKNVSITIESDDDSDFATPKKPANKRKLKSDLLDANLSGSDSDVGAKKKKKGRGKKRKKEEEEDEEPDPEDEVYSDDDKKKKGKRKRIRKVASSSDEEKNKEEAGEEEDEDLEDTPGGAHKRKKIRKVMANKKLADSTKEARKIEEERRKRIEERQKEFNAFVEVEGGEEEEEVPEGTEREKKEADDSIAKILGTAKKVPVTTKCVLDMDKAKQKVLVEIDRTLVRKLKPHQVEAVRFMYNCCVESIERLKKEDGAGCILAHCMGLGKTLSVISFLHTMLANTKLTKMTKCLVVCPLNTVLNWVNEFEIWLEDVDYEIVIYEMSKVKQNFERAQMLREWHEGEAGVMILGYDMYRNLVQGSHCKNKKQKATFFETLADPGPDIVVCDEGHILKNDQTSLSKAMNKIKSRRRVVLTGTPLQNNLGEYHCMVDFVKPSLLGTRKEFCNRFVNPITNGQCSDSTGSDVKLMKRRAHILHEMLAGCVQRKDYSALTKFLPPKFEYVVAVRMSKLQCTLYDRYLSESGIVQNEEVQGKGGRLFRDYQALMRIWTHPWVLKLDEIRQENKRTYDSSDDSFIDDEEESDEDSFISGSTTSESEPDTSSKKKKSKGKKGKKRGAKGSDSDSDSDVKEVNEENEVIKKWSSKRRGNEEGAGSSWMQDMGYSTGPKEVSNEWWAEFVKEEDEFKIELSGKLSLMFEILRMCEDIGDKVLIFSQSLLSLDIIEDFLHYVDEQHNKDQNEEGKEDEEKTNGETSKEKDAEKKEKTEEEKKKEEEKKEQDKKKEKYAEYGKSWTVGADYFRMDGSTSSQQRKAAQDSFNDPENYRARLFLISTKAGSLGINLVAANRVIIFDASWNPSHDIQSIFRVYRFGQIKPVYVYRFLAQGTMEEKIYERQVTKQSLSQRVVDEHQIERHFTANDLQELYKFQPDKLDDPERKERPLPMLPKDHMLAELMSTQKDWIVTFHEHDSLLENIVEQELSEDEKKAAWEDYENEKKGLNNSYQMYGNMMSAQQRMNSALEFQNLVLQGQANLGQEAVLQIVQDLKARFPTLPPEVFSQRVQAVLRQVLTQRIMQQSDFQRRQLDQQKMAELNRLNQIKQQIQQQQAMLNNQQRNMGVGGNYYNSLYGVQALPSSGFSNSLLARSIAPNPPAAHSSSASATEQPAQKSSTASNSKGDKK